MKFGCGKMRINNVEIEDTYAEVFNMYMSRFLITAITNRWALFAAFNSKGSVQGAGEASVETEVSLLDTPDKRPGYVVMVAHFSQKELSKWLVARIRKGVMPIPTTATFDAMPDRLVEYFIDIKDTSIQLFGDGYEENVKIFDREMYKIPRMDGFFYIDTRMGARKGIAGGNFFVLGQSQGAALLAAEVAVQAMRKFPHVVVLGPVPAASGSKVGGKNYQNATATTNEKYCPCIMNKVPDTKIPNGVTCVYELTLNGLELESVKKAMAAGILAATKVEGISKITAGNFEGRLGQIKINLHDIL
jgi:formylmethanofuran--tetrahydromethanopterin N-formyltransferase